MLVTVFSGCDTSLSGGGSTPPSNNDHGLYESYEEYKTAGYVSFFIKEEDLEVLYNVIYGDTVSANAIVYSLNKKAFITDHFFGETKVGETELTLNLINNDDIEVDLVYSEEIGGAVVKYLSKRAASLDEYINNGYLTLEIDDSYGIFYRLDSKDDSYFYLISYGVYSLSDRSILFGTVDDKIDEGREFVWVRNGETVYAKVTVENGKLITVPVGDHDHGFNLFHGDSEHWYKCECGEKKDFAPHQSNGFKSDNSSHWEECTVCLARLNVTSHSFKNYESNATHHWEKCSVCGYSTTKALHSPSQGSCTYCGKKLESIGLEFEETDGGYAVISLGSCTDKAIYIPSFYNNKAVVAIFSSAFEGSNIEAVFVPDTVLEIGSSAFAGCEKLKTVVLPYNISEIKDNTFGGCMALESINVPANLIKIGASAFSNCVKLKSFDFSEINEIGSFAFANCTSLSSDVVIKGRGVDVSVGDNAFSGCTSVKKVAVNANYAEILSGAFRGCTALKEVFFGGPFVAPFDICTFADCTSLTTVKLTGLREDWIIILGSSTGGSDGEMADLSWYANTGNFVIKFDDNTTMTKSELDTLYGHGE